MARIGIRREDKSDWEARAPLVPVDVEPLVKDHGLEITVQTSAIRAFPEDAYAAAGASVADDLTDCPIILGVKEIPPERLEPGKTYVFFSHTIKGQPANMPMLQRLIALRCQLIDYERIVDAKGRRLVFFGRFAGLAGMIDTLWALGRRLEHEGAGNPFVRIKRAHEYNDLAQARSEIAALAGEIRRNGLPETVQPLVCGFAGYGQVSRGAQEIFDLLRPAEVAPQDLASMPPSGTGCYKVVFREEHMVERSDASSPFVLQEYYDHPDRYRACFLPYVRHLTLLVNCIYWEPKYPRLITRDQFREHYAGARHPRLRVIGDISCDIDGSVACTVRTTPPDDPVYVYDPSTGDAQDGVAGEGPVVLAVDILPSELPVDASNAFSEVLSPLLPGLAGADVSGDLADSSLPPELTRATIVYQGALTEPYRYLEEHVSGMCKTV